MPSGSSPPAPSDLADGPVPRCRLLFFTRHTHSVCGMISDHEEGAAFIRPISTKAVYAEFTTTRPMCLLYSTSPHVQYGFAEYTANQYAPSRSALRLLTIRPIMFSRSAFKILDIHAFQLQLISRRRDAAIYLLMQNSHPALVPYGSPLATCRPRDVFVLTF